MVKSLVELINGFQILVNGSIVASEVLRSVHWRIDSGHPIHEIDINIMEKL